MRWPVDVSTRVSPELSALIEALVNDGDREDPPTLAEVRHAVRAMIHQRPAREALVHPPGRSLQEEIDALVEEFGAEAPAFDFVRATASEALTRIIETAMTLPGLSRAPTLGAVRERMVDGLIAQLVGDGAIDADDDGPLLAEIDDLIDRHGTDAPAEAFVRFE